MYYFDLKYPERVNSETSIPLEPLYCNQSAHLGRSTETPADQDAVMFLKTRYK